MSWASFHLPLSWIYTSVTIKGIRDFVLTDYRLQIHIFQQDDCVAKDAGINCVNEAFLYQMPPLLMVASSWVFPHVPPM